MGTYLTLELKDKSDKGIAKANALWTYENQEKGYRTAVQFRTKQDQLTDIEYIKLDDGQKHLKGLSIKELENRFGRMFERGIFHVKITLGDYLCSAMASRVLAFIDRHEDLLVDTPKEYVMEILEKTRRQNHKAEECFADCPHCKSEV